MLFGLLLGVFSLVFVLHKFMAVQAAVDKYAYDGAVKAVRLRSSSSGVTLQVDDEALRTWLEATTRNLEHEIRVELEAPGRELWIESSYAVLSFDAASGQSQGVMELPYRYHFMLGSLSVPSGLLVRSDPGEEFVRLAGLTQGVMPQALMALPSGLNWQEESPLRYQDRVVAVHLRAFVSFEDDLAGRIYAWFGGEPVAWSAKAIVLRREL